MGSSSPEIGSRAQMPSLVFLSHPLFFFFPKAFFFVMFKFKNRFFFLKKMQLGIVEATLFATL